MINRKIQSPLLLIILFFLLGSNTLYAGLSKEVDVAIVAIKFSEDTSQSYGYDDFTNNNIPYKSVKIGGTDNVKAEIKPTSASNDIFFQSTNTGNVTVTPEHANSANLSLTLKGIAKGASDVDSKAGSKTGTTISTLKVASYNERSKTLAVRLVHEDNDDLQKTPVGTASNSCVESGTNNRRDTNPSGDDTVSGEDITSGPDGVCDTTANNTDILSTDINLTSLTNSLNTKFYNQSVVKWTVKRLPTMTVNFDLNRDGMIDVSSWMAAEMQVIRDNCSDNGYDHNIFLVNNPNDGSCGFMDYNQRYGYVHLDNSIDYNNTIAHELGHGGFGLLHTTPDRDNIMYDYNSATAWRLRKDQWDKCNP
ncbi:hypothetical protein QUF90_03755 [Desulfococcaceae bacterium HSG9]|nr:hypothetical protein [Desulfococcaceae bacterium HSG9]